MTVLSPVGTFPVRIRRVRLAQRRVVADASMGAWQSQITLGREDVPVALGAVALLGIAFAVGRVTA